MLTVASSCAARAPSCRPNGSRAGVRSARRGPRDAARGRGSGLAARGRARAKFAIATRRGWARSTCCRPASSRARGGFRTTRARCRRPGADLEVWRERIRRHPGELKNLLKNQAFVAGIGNAYSDEILHAARLCPSGSVRRSGREVDALYEATGATLLDAIEELRGACRRRSRSRSATSSPSTTRAASPARVADEDQRGQARRFCDVLLSRLPALSDQGIFRTWPVWSVDDVRPLSFRIADAVVLNFAATPISVSPFLTV